jgi:hypothetical protein
MPNISTKSVAGQFGEETKVITKKTYVSEGRKDVLLSRKQEATAFSVLRYYNWSKSFGMKTQFLSNMSNASYGILQTLNTVSAFATSDSLVRSIAARYGWVVAGRAFGRVQGKVLPQGGGPFGRFARVKGGQFSRKVLGNFMNYFTTTTMEFENVAGTQRKIMKQLQTAGSIGPTWAGMALAEAITGAPDPYATQARKVMKGGRERTMKRDAGFASDAEAGKTDSYLSKRADILQNMGSAGMSAPEMTYLIKAMEQGGDPDDIMKKYNALSSDIMNTLNKHSKLGAGGTTGHKGQRARFIQQDMTDSMGRPVMETASNITGYDDSGTLGFGSHYLQNQFNDGTGGGPSFYPKANKEESVIRGGKASVIEYSTTDDTFGSYTQFNEDATQVQQQRVNEILSEALGVDLYKGPQQIFESFFGGSSTQMGPSEMKYGKDSKKTSYQKIIDPKTGKYAGSKEVITGGTIKDKTGEYSQVSNQLDHTNYRLVRSSSNPKEHNYIASRPDIIKGLRMIDAKNLHKKNPKGGFLAYGIELYQHKGLRDVEQIEYGGPATDLSRSLRNRTDRYVYARSMFVHQAAQKAANKLGLDADLKFSNRKADVMGTLRQRQTKAIAQYQKDKNQHTSTKGGFTLLVDKRVREILKEDLKRARSPRVVDGNKLKFNDMKVSDNLIQAGEYNSLRKGANTVYFTDDAGNRLSHTLSPKDYPPEFLNEFDKLREDLKKNFTSVSGDMPLSDEYYLSGAFARSDARRRQAGILSDDLGRNEFGNRRQLTPTQLRRQNFRVRGGVYTEDDILSQALAETAEELFPEYLSELSVIQKGIEDKIKIKVEQGQAAIKKQKLKGEAKRRAYNDLEFEADQMYEKGYQDAVTQANAKVLGNLNATHPVVREKLDDINKQIEGVIRGSGNRNLNQFKMAPIMIQSKYTQYHNALMKGDGAVAKDILNELTDDGKIKLKAVENHLGYRMEMIGNQANGNPIYRRVPLSESNNYQTEVEVFRGTPYREATAIVNGKEVKYKIRVDEDDPGVKNYRDLERNQKKGNAGLNDIGGVGSNINKSKSNKFGDPTGQQALKELKKGDYRLFGGIGNATDISSEKLLEGVDSMLDSPQSKDLMRAYKDVRSHVIVNGSGTIIGGLYGGEGQFESIAGGQTGKATPKFKKALTRISSLSYSDEEMFTLLHLFLAVEENQEVKKELIAVFDPTTDYGKLATGQSARRKGHALGERFGGGSRVLDSFMIEQMKAVLRTNSNKSKIDLFSLVRVRLR